MVKEEELDVALVRVYTKAFQLGIVDGPAPGNPNPYSKIGPEAVDSPAHRALAIEGALQGIVLLKNEGATLPLPLYKPWAPAGPQIKQQIKQLALIGPHANGSTIFLGGPGYHGVNEIVDQYTPLLRAQAWMGNYTNVTYALGCNVEADDDDEGGFSEAVAMAAAADQVILFLGLDDFIDGEGQDRASLELPGVQAELAMAVATAAKKPIVVVLVNGCPLAIKELKESDKV
jgi:beta-glucosidase-like glycosyl hydrolase